MNIARDLEALRACVGKIVESVEYDERSDVFKMSFDDGTSLLLFHTQDCCEFVHLYDVIGDYDDLIGEPLLVVESRSDDDVPRDVIQDHAPESQTWTFYTFRTVKGTVDLRWFGSSNGYYSESVSAVLTDE